MTYNKEYFLSLLSSLIKVKKVTQEQLSREIHVATSSINRFLNNKNDISSSTLIDILNYLEVDLTSLLEAKLKKATGIKEDEEDIANSLAKVVHKMSPLQKKTLLQSLITFSKNRKELKAEYKNLTMYKKCIVNEKREG